ncbi:tyrosine-type recombinase/integrase [Actinomadura formosensis]|uniref:tyrosine-type recombinase/integrase n=1 Tax=Actinomadura formosensis TaxID=60706 RepID=UPI00083431A4|nr:tyrosine-type recombinase/integrase [Actinomadura formosensis]
MASHIRVSYKTKNLPKSKRRWEVSYTDPLTGKKRTKGGFIREKDAKAWQIKFEDSSREQLYVDDKAGSVVFNDAARQWLNGRRNLKERTYNDYKGLLGLGESKRPEPDPQRLLLRNRFGSAPVSAITEEAVQEWVSDMERAGKSGGTIRKSFILLKQVMKEQLRLKRVAVNPCADVEIPKFQPWALLTDEDEGRRLEPEEVERLAAALPHPFGFLALFTAYTGLRAGEVAGLQLRDIDLAAGIVRVRREVTDINGILSYDEPKSRKAKREVTLDPYILEELRAYIREHEKAAAAWFGERDDVQHPGKKLPLFVGTAKGRRGKNPVTGKFDVIRFDYTKLLRHKAWYGRYFKKALAAAGLDSSYRFHDLRHSYGSWLYDAGVDIKTISRMMGHASVETTMAIYVHPDRDKANDAVRNALGNLRAGSANRKGNVVPLRRQA